MAFANPITQGTPTAKAPRLGADEHDIETGISRSSTPEPSPSAVEVQPKKRIGEMFQLEQATGIVKGKGGKKKTRKTKKSLRKTKKHLRRK